VARDNDRTGNNENVRFFSEQKESHEPIDEVEDEDSNHLPIPSETASSNQGGSGAPQPEVPAPPADLGQLKAMFRILVTLARTQTVAITLNLVLLNWLLVDQACSIMQNTHHFVVVGRERLKLFWFEQYGAIMTPQHLYVEYCRLSNGDVIVGVWETRCNRPFHAILVWRKDTGKCELFTVADHRHLFPGVVMDPSGTFDFDICYA
jgi:hypothetical protein